MKHKLKSGKFAFTLPEVVITGFVTVLMMIPISRIAFTTMISTRYARDVGSALAAGQSRMERFAEVEFTNLNTGTATDGDYELAWTVTSISGGDAKIVELNVSWKILGRDQSITLNNVFTRNIPGGFNFD